MDNYIDKLCKSGGLCPYNELKHVKCRLKTEGRYENYFLLSAKGLFVLYDRCRLIKVVFGTPVYEAIYAGHVFWTRGAIGEVIMNLVPEKNHCTEEGGFLIRFFESKCHQSSICLHKGVHFMSTFVSPFRNCKSCGENCTHPRFESEILCPCKQKCTPLPTLYELSLCTARLLHKDEKEDLPRQLNVIALTTRRRILQQNERYRKDDPPVWTLADCLYIFVMFLWLAGLMYLVHVFFTRTKLHITN